MIRINRMDSTENRSENWFLFQCGIEHWILDFACRYLLDTTSIHTHKVQIITTKWTILAYLQWQSYTHTSYDAFHYICTNAPLEQFRYLHWLKCELNTKFENVEVEWNYGYMSFEQIDRGLQSVSIAKREQENRLKNGKEDTVSRA